MFSCLLRSARRWSSVGSDIFGGERYGCGLAAKHCGVEAKMVGKELKAGRFVGWGIGMGIGTSE